MGLVAVAVIQGITERRSPWTALGHSAPSTKAALAVIALVLLGGWWAYNFWDGFLDHAHGYAAVAMFGFLALAVASNAWELRERRNGWFWAYASIAVAMPLAGAVVWAVGDSLDHAVLVLEAIEIALFVAFWAVQTVRHWDRVTSSRGIDPDIDLTIERAEIPTLAGAQP
jgi:hypothetical protein